MNIVGSITAIILFITFVSLAIDNWTEWKAQHSDTMTCDAIINVHKEHQLLSIRLKYSFLGHEGVANLSGVLNNGNKGIFSISRTVLFKYKRINEGVYLENTTTTISLQDTAGPDGL
ncbi:hypothetical protein, partial [Klebsiella pneumoniae]